MRARWSILVDIEQSGSRLLDGNIVELEGFRRRRQAPFVDRLVGNRFRGREAIHIPDKFFDALTRRLKNGVEIARSTGFHRRHSFVHVGR